MPGAGAVTIAITASIGIAPQLPTEFDVSLLRIGTGDAISTLNAAFRPRRKKFADIDITAATARRIHKLLICIDGITERHAAGASNMI
jgi:hypothetical protein